MFLQQLFNGIALGSTYALVAIGYSLVFGVLRIINFANGALYMLGAYLVFVLFSAMHGHLAAAIALSLLATAGLGFCVDFIGLRKLRRDNAPKMSGLISTMGIATVIENAIQIWIGTETKQFPNFLYIGRVRIGGAIVSSTQIFVFLISLALMAIFSLVVYKTKIGRSMRAVSQNLTTAQLMGINVKLVISGTFMVSGLLAAVAGTLVGSYYQAIDTLMSSSVGMKTFAAAVLGGVGSLPGAMVGGLLVGVAESIGASYISSGYRDAIAFAILVAVILIKPSGIFGKKIVEKM